MPRVFRHYVPLRLLLLMGAEGTIVFGSLYVGLLLPLLGISAILPAWGSAVPSALALSVLVLLMAHIAGLYDMPHDHGRLEILIRQSMAFVGAYLAIAVFGYLVAPWKLGRKAYVLSFLVALPLIFVLRLGYDRLNASNQRRRKVLLLGSGRVNRLIADTINASHDGYEVVGCLDSGDARVGADVNGIKILGSVEDVDWISRVARPDVIVVALEERRRSLPLSGIVECKLRGIDVEDWPDFYEKLTGKIPVMDLRPSWLIFSDGFKKTRLTLMAKRAMDILLSLAGCLVTLPLVLLIAALIKLDSPGPVFFPQVRLGQHGRAFSVLKFRSMRVNAGRHNGPGEDQTSRVTRVGRLLRRSRLDELPQLFNVLRGEMSLVGPRPEWMALVPGFHEKVPFYLHRLAVKPGLTGWAQVKNAYGASIENTLEKLQYDLYYIKNMSVFLDLLILLRTVQIVLFTRGSQPWTSNQRHESTFPVSSAG